MRALAIWDTSTAPFASLTSALSSAITTPLRRFNVCRRTAVNSKPDVANKAAKPIKIGCIEAVAAFDLLPIVGAAVGAPDGSSGRAVVSAGVEVPGVFWVGDDTGFKVLTLVSVVDIDDESTLTAMLSISCTAFSNDDAERVLATPDETDSALLYPNSLNVDVISISISHAYVVVAKRCLRRVVAGETATLKLVIASSPMPISEAIVDLSAISCSDVDEDSAIMVIDVDRTIESDAVGLTLGAKVEAGAGAAVGPETGPGTGDAVGVETGTDSRLGAVVGSWMGAPEGADTGAGPGLGADVGTGAGNEDAEVAVGSWLGACVGAGKGFAEGADIGSALGRGSGARVGDCDGAEVY